VFDIQSQSYCIINELENRVDITITVVDLNKHVQFVYYVAEVQ